MDITWIQTFVAAAEEGNFHRAADRLHLAQPTVSIHIQKLESTWGVSLFERIGRNVHLSRAGHRFLVHAKKILDDYVASLEDLARWQQGVETTLKIAASPVVATTWLPRWIQGFSQLHSSVEFSIQVVDSDQILPFMLEQGADLGFSRCAIRHPQVQCSQFYEDPIILVAPRDEYDLDGPIRTLPELLERYPLFTHHHPEYWDQLLVNLRAMIPTMRTLQVNQGLVALEWVTEKLGVSFFSQSIVRKALLRGTVEQIPFTAFSIPVTCSYLVLPIQPTDLTQRFANSVRQWTQLHP